MVESKYTKVRVNNEIELCQVPGREIKDKIEKAFVRHNISFFIKCTRKHQGRRTDGNLYTISVNQYQRQKAEAVIHEVLENVNESVVFLDKKREKGFQLKSLFLLDPM